MNASQQPPYRALVQPLDRAVLMDRTLASQRFGDRLFAARLLRFMRNAYPEETRNLSDVQLSNRIGHMVTRGRAWGLTWQSALATFGSLMLVISPRFDDNPAIRAALSDGEESPDVRISQLRERVPEGEWERARRHCGDAGVYWRDIDSLPDSDPDALPADNVSGTIIYRTRAADGIADLTVLLGNEERVIVLDELTPEQCMVTQDFIIGLPESALVMWRSRGDGSLHRRLKSISLRPEIQHNFSLFIEIGEGDHCVVFAHEGDHRHDEDEDEEDE